jgi:GDPmannose 4,6-dehydratase
MKALITGATGQDGSYLTEFLLNNGYEVLGLARRVANRELPNWIECCDITDASAVAKVCTDFKPDEVYNLAAMSHVGESFKQPNHCFEVNAVGALNVLTAARNCGAKFYQASTSELFGTTKSPQNESTDFHPRSPYGVAKLAAYWATVNSREAYKHFACNGILFNHESPRRGADFVTQKVVKAAARGESVTLGNLQARRDWGHAKDYVRAMWMMMQQSAPGDYVVATGVSHSVMDLCRTAYAIAGLDWQEYVKTSSSLLRPTEVPDLCGDAGKISAIGWEPEYTFEEIIKEMYDHEVRAINRSSTRKTAEVYS